MEPLECNQQYADDADADNNDNHNADNDEVVGSQREPPPHNKWNHLRATILNNSNYNTLHNGAPLTYFFVMHF